MEEIKRKVSPKKKGIIEKCIFPLELYSNLHLSAGKAVE